MDNQKLKNIMQEITPVPEQEWLEFEKFFVERVLLKNDFLWKEGQVCKHVVFIKKGLMYCYYEREEKKVTANVYFEGSVFYDDYSFITQEACTLNYVALEKTELIVIPKSALEKMFDKYKSFERLGRLMVERVHAINIKDNENRDGKNAEEKYLNMIANHPILIQRIPLKILASYLNITPEHLSRIRKKISLNSDV